MSDAYRMLLGFHVLVGTAALATFWGAVLARKGGTLHRRSGYGFAVTMTMTAATAVPLSLLLLWDPLMVRPPDAELTAAGRVEYAALMREIGSGLLEVSLVTGVLLQFGLAALRRRRAVAAQPQPVDLACAAAAVAAGLIMATLGVSPALPYFTARGIVLATVGVLQLRALGTQPPRSAWIGHHVNGVMGAGAIAHGSLTVNIARQFTNDVGLMFLPATVTLLVFAVATRIIAQRWRRKLDGAAQRRPASVARPLALSSRALDVVG